MSCGSQKSDEWFECCDPKYQYYSYISRWAAPLYILADLSALLLNCLSEIFIHIKHFDYNFRLQDGVLILKWPPGFLWRPAASFNILRLRQNGSHFVDNTFKCIFMNANLLIQISPKFVPKDSVNNNSCIASFISNHGVEYAGKMSHCFPQGKTWSTWVVKWKKMQIYFHVL